MVTTPPSLQGTRVLVLGLGASGLAMAGHRLGVPPGQEDRPVLTAADIPDVSADFVADPFLLQRDGRWFLFFEIMERHR